MTMTLPTASANQVKAKTVSEWVYTGSFFPTLTLSDETTDTGDKQTKEKTMSDDCSPIMIYGITFYCTRHGGPQPFGSKSCRSCYPELPSKKETKMSKDTEQGLKYDQEKPDFTYISYELLDVVSQVRAFGAKKYARDNWKKGFKVTRSLAAALRHIYLFLAGETLDKESGLPHLGHAVCCLEHAIYDMHHRPQNDDRNNKLN